MKLFIWEDVLCDWTEGLAIGYGKDLEAVLAEFEPFIARRLGQPTKVIDTAKDRRTYVVYVYGGG